ISHDYEPCSSSDLSYCVQDESEDSDDEKHFKNVMRSNGLINFISDGYGGRATDVMIVQHCGYLDCLPPKKAVTADRGFKDLSHLLGARDCTLVRTPSVSQSNPTQDKVKQSKQIAALRIHVERVINRLREFYMLLPHACVDYNLIPVIDDAITLACGLVTIQDVLIKKMN
ncbi:hypothetical protein SFRURICE_010691, partial [Spodoptera frugiperda]